MMRLISSVAALQGGNSAPLHSIPDFPSEGIGAEIGSNSFIAPWTLETLVNELLATPKDKYFGRGRTRTLRHDRFEVLRMLAQMIIKLENFEDRIFLEKHDVFNEMSRIAQRQFPWQRGVSNSPSLYRSLLLYGSGTAADYFENENGIAISDFVKIGTWLSTALSRSEFVQRETDLASIAITPNTRETALNKFSLRHEEARDRTIKMRSVNLHTGYKPSILRDFPIIAFGKNGERLRAPFPELIVRRYTEGLYLDVVQGGGAIWADIGRRFEYYCLDYFGAMMEPYKVDGERDYGPKKAQYRTPDVMISDSGGVLMVAECKAKRMSFEARFSDDPVAQATVGFDEISKGIFQIWRFFSHARQGLFASKVTKDCQGIVLTADTWLAMARNQEAQVYEAAHVLADRDGSILVEDRRDVAVCVIDDVEYVLQNGNADTFLKTCRDVTSGEKKGWILSLAHLAEQDQIRPYPFTSRISEFLPWWVTAQS